MKVASLKAEVNIVMAYAETTKVALQEKLEGVASAFLDIETTLDLTIFPGVVAYKSCSHCGEDHRAERGGRGGHVRH